MLSKLAPRLEFTIQPQKVSHIICCLAEKVIFLGSGVFSVCSLVKIVSNMITYCINYATIQVFYDSYVSVEGQNVQGENTGNNGKIRVGENSHSGIIFCSISACLCCPYRFSLIKYAAIN